MSGLPRAGRGQLRGETLNSRPYYRILLGLIAELAPAFPADPEADPGRLSLIAMVAHVLEELQPQRVPGLCLPMAGAYLAQVCFFGAIRRTPICHQCGLPYESCCHRRCHQSIGCAAYLSCLMLSSCCYLMPRLLLRQAG